MRVEACYPVDALTDGSRSWPQSGYRLAVNCYYATGEEVPPGFYTCTFCGGSTRLRRQSVLTLCSFCDSAEFIKDEAIEAQWFLD